MGHGTGVMLAEKLLSSLENYRDCILLNVMVQISIKLSGINQMNKS